MSDVPGASSATPQSGGAAFPTAASAASEPAVGAGQQITPPAQPPVQAVPAPAVPAQTAPAPAAPPPSPAPATPAASPAPKPTATFAAPGAAQPVHEFAEEGPHVPMVGIVKEFSDWLRFLVEQGGSDLHVKVGS